MHRVRDVTSGMRLIIAVVCILFLVMPGVVFAETMDTTAPGIEVPAIVPNVTSVPVTPAPPLSGPLRTRPA